MSVPAVASLGLLVSTRRSVSHALSTGWASPVVLFVAAVAVAGVVLIGAVSYYWTQGGPAPARTRHGLTPLRSGIAVVAGLCVTALVFLTVDVDPATAVGGRRPILRVAVWVVLVVGGCEGVAGAYGFARRWWAVRPVGIAATGSVGAGTAAVFGTVVDENTATAPVTGRAAVCWSWTVSVTGPGLRDPSDDDYHGTVDGGTGGTRFLVDDGTGPLRIDPDDATLDLACQRDVTVASVGDRPDGFDDPAPDVEADYGDRPREYTESILRPAGTVTVWGPVTERDGTPTLGGSGTTVVAGPPDRIARRYRRRALGYAAAGVVAVVAGVAGLVWTVGRF